MLAMAHRLETLVEGACPTEAIEFWEKTDDGIADVRHYGSFGQLEAYLASCHCAGLGFLLVILKKDVLHVTS
jgi:hypothetical protein